MFRTITRECRRSLSSQARYLQNVKAAVVRIKSSSITSTTQCHKHCTEYVSLSLTTPAPSKQTILQTTTRSTPSSNTPTSVVAKGHIALYIDRNDTLFLLDRRGEIDTWAAKTPDDDDFKVVLKAEVVETLDVYEDAYLLGPTSNTPPGLSYKKRTASPDRAPERKEIGWKVGQRSVSDPQRKGNGTL
jgi:hypothetical protein